MLSRPAVACSITGVGEHVMRALLARDCADRLVDREVSVADACSRAIEESILQARWGPPQQPSTRCTTCCNNQFPVANNQTSRQTVRA